MYVFMLFSYEVCDLCIVFIQSVHKVIMNEVVEEVKPSQKPFSC